MKNIFGGILIAFGLFMFLGFLMNLADESFAINIGDIGALIILGIVPIGAGGMLIRSRLKDKQKALQDRKHQLQKKLEKQVLRIAQQKGGRLTVPEIAADTSMSITEAEEFMREMASNGYVDMQVTDSGVIVYEFYEIAHKKSLEE